MEDMSRLYQQHAQTVYKFLLAQCRDCLLYTSLKTVTDLGYNMRSTLAKYLRQYQEEEPFYGQEFGNRMDLLLVCGCLGIPNSWP